MPTDHPARRTTQRLVFEQLRARGAASRAELAKFTGLSAPTVGKVADELLAQHLLEEPDEPAASAATLGRPSRPLRLDRRTPRLLAIQVGVRHTRLAALPVAGPADDRWPVQFDTPARLPTFLERLADAARQLPLKTPWAVTVSVPGVVDEPAGRVLLCPNLPWLDSAILPELLAATLRLPADRICCTQEIRALALGHLWSLPTPAATLPSFVLVDFGEGVGGAVVTRGQLYDPPLPLSGELGHSRVLDNPRPCACGAVGCLETLVARRGLLASFAQAHPRAPDHSWRALVKHVETHGIDPWLAKSLDASAAAVSSAMNLLGVREAVITGALIELPGVVLEHLANAIRASAMWARFGQITITPAPRHRAAGLTHAAIDRLLLPQAN